MGPSLRVVVSLARAARVVQHSRQLVPMDSFVRKKWSESQMDSKPILSASRAISLIRSYVKPNWGSIWIPKSKSVIDNTLSFSVL